MFRFAFSPPKSASARAQREAQQLLMQKQARQSYETKPEPKKPLPPQDHST